MANMYRSVLAGGGGVQPTGDAVAADVLTGKTFSNASAVGISGTMPNNGAVSGTATPDQPYTIPAGYHNGSGTVIAVGVDVIPANKGIKIAPTGISEIDISSGSLAITAAAGGAITSVVVNVSQFSTVRTTSDQLYQCVGFTNTGDITSVSVPYGQTVNISAYDYLAFYTYSDTITFA